MRTHDDWLLERVFEPMAAETTKQGFPCYVLGNVCCVVALALLYFSVRVWLETEPAGFLEYSFLVAPLGTAALLLNVWLYVTLVERDEARNQYPYPRRFRGDRLLYWYRFGAFFSALTLIGMLVAQRHDKFTTLWELSFVPIVLGLYFFSCTRLLSEPDEEAVHSH